MAEGLVAERHSQHISPATDFARRGWPRRRKERNFTILDHHDLRRPSNGRSREINVHASIVRVPITSSTTWAAGLHSPGS